MSEAVADVAPDICKRDFFFIKRVLFISGNVPDFVLEKTKTIGTYDV